MSTHFVTKDAGKSFGEIALIHNKQRAASIRTLDDCYFATMNKKSFEKVMLQMKMRENDKIVEFLDRFSIIKPLTYQTKTMLGYCGKEFKYGIGQSVLKEGDLCSSVYLIKDGEFEIRKDVYQYKDRLKDEHYCMFSQLY
jgi:cAMP-dependent protein kinase regulator